VPKCGQTRRAALRILVPGIATGTLGHASGLLSVDRMVVRTGLERQGWSGTVEQARPKVPLPGQHQRVVRPPAKQGSGTGRKAAEVGRALPCPSEAHPPRLERHLATGVFWSSGLMLFWLDQKELVGSPARPLAPIDLILDQRKVRVKVAVEDNAECVHRGDARIQHRVAVLPDQDRVQDRRTLVLSQT